MPVIPHTLIDVLRHGEPEGGERFRGTVDDPLSPTGWAQMQAACAAGRWDRVVSSPQRRCVEFAARLAGERGIAHAVDEDFREIGFGAWEGLTSAEVIARHGTALRAYWRDPVSHTPQGAEPVAEFARRVGGAWQRLLTGCAAAPGQRVLLVAHGGVTRMVVREVLAVPLDYCWRMRVPYASVARVELQHDPGGLLPVLVLLGAPAALGG